LAWNGVSDSEECSLPIWSRVQLVGLGGANGGFHDSMQNVLVELCGPDLALGAHMVGHELIRQFGHGGRAAFGGPLTRWIVSMHHRTQDGLGACPGEVWRDFSHRRDGVASHG